MTDHKLRRDALIGLSLCIAFLALDGFDNQILALSIPTMMREWQVGRSAFAPTLAMTVVMMSVGTGLAGWLGDRAGRRTGLAVALLILAIFSVATSFSTNPTELLIFRSLASLGLGGVIPNATALLAELAPDNRKSLSVALGMSCIPLGGLAAGLIAPTILATLSWPGLFQLGGVLTLGVTATLLLLKEHDRDRLDPPPLKLGSIERAHSEGLFGRAFRADTCALWAAFFFCMLAIYSMFNWIPTVLAGAGFGDGVASFGLVAFNIGGITGSIAVAVALDRYGSRRTLVSAAIAGAFSAIAATWAILAAASPAVIYTSLIAAGFSIGGLQTGLFALSAQVYPAKIRATGIGAAVAFGRLGAIASSVAGTLVLDGGTGWFMALIGTSAVISGCALILLGRHVPFQAGRKDSPVQPSE